MRILFFTEISPFPINGGEKIRTFGLIKALSLMGHEVLALVKDLDAKALSFERKIENVTFFSYESPRKGLIKNALLAGYFQKDPILTAFLREFISTKKPDVCFIDYAFNGQYIELFKGKGIPVIYGTHNSQSGLTKQRPVSGLCTFLRKWQRVVVEIIHERLFFPKADALVVVSKFDYAFHSRFVDKQKIFIVPNFLDQTRYSIVDTNIEFSDYIVMSANFTAYMNLEGIRWLLEEVWDLEVDKTLKLVLVGKGSEKLLQQIPSAQKYTNVTFVGPVDDILPFIKNAKAFIVPLLHGSGSRLKCLEAMAMKVPVVSTAKGVEGIDSKHFMIANCAKDFKKMLLQEGFLSRANVEGAYLDFLEKYSIDSASSNLKDVVGFVSS